MNNVNWQWINNLWTHEVQRWWNQGRIKTSYKRERKYRESIIQNFTAPRYILLFNSFVRWVGWVEPAHYKLHRQNIWKHIASQNYFTGICCLNSPCLSAASTLLFDHNQFSSALAFQSTRNIKIKWNLETQLEITNNDQLAPLTIQFITFLFCGLCHVLKCHTDLLHCSA